MNLKKEAMKQKTRVMKQMAKQDMVRRLHTADNMIRKMDQQIPLIKEYNQKNPKDLQLVPCGKIHKLMV